MNIHHLELFYYVARHGGISEAARNMPYGIQQPAISAQIIQLEDYLGVTLFQRRPFELTPAGEKLYTYIDPFFSNLDAVAADLQGGTLQPLRVGASEIILRDHLPCMLSRLRKRFPKLKLVLREGYQPELEQWLLKQEIDMALTLVDRKAQPGFHTHALIELPIVLLVEKRSRIKSAEELWKRDRIDEPLICLPASEPVCKAFQQGLTKLRIDWFPSIEVSSVELIETYVANGFGTGVSISVPKSKLPPGVRSIPLEGFPTITVGAVWRGRLPSVYKVFLDEAQARVKELLG